MPKSTEEVIRRLEEKLGKYYSGEQLKNGCDFIAHMRNTGIIPGIKQPNLFEYLGENVCVLVDWTIFWGDYTSTLLLDEYQDFPIDDDLKQFVWDNIHTCAHFHTKGKECGCGGQPGKSVSLFGKEFDNVCSSIIYFNEPDADTLQKVYQLTELWKRAIEVANSSDKNVVDNKDGG